MGSSHIESYSPLQVCSKSQHLGGVCGGGRGLHLPYLPDASYGSANHCTVPLK